MGLVAAGNTYNPSLLVLREMGYELRAEESDDGESLFWTATKSGELFLAYSPPELLGVVVLWERMGRDWNRQEPDLLGELCGIATC